VNLAKSQIVLTMKSGADEARPKGADRNEGRLQVGASAGPEATLSTGALKNDALKKLEEFKGALKRGR
jgi:hypothetical protein